ncbi:MAG: response regulator [Clostridiaceae bacterium]|nr:response regulator [Clostridiaceae bacterium]
MFNILIVDDDYLFRSYLKNYIDYEKINCSVCYEAENGKIALDVIKNEPVHIVITDMSMPVMNGVQLISEAKRLKNELVFIALSGFEDFEYVKESMKNGAIDYILKHRISEDYLIDILVKAKKQLNVSNVSIKTDNFEHYQKNLRVEFVKHLLLEGFSDKEQANKLLEQILPGINPSGIKLLLMEIDNFKTLEKKWSTPKQQNYFITQVIDICQHILDDMLPGIVAHIENSRIVILFSDDAISEKIHFANTNKIISRIKNSIKKFLNITCCVAVSSICRDITKLENYYQEVLEKMKLKFYMGYDGVFFENPPIEKCGELNHGDIDLSEIRSWLFNYSFNKIQEKLEEIYSIFYEKRCEQEVVMAVSFELIGILVATCHEFVINVENLYIDGNIPYTQIQEADTFQQIKTTIISLYERAFEQIRIRELPPEYSEITRKTILYLFSNYMNAISLDDVAGYIGVNNAYLSRIFKKDTGRGFIEYLNMFRIDISKRMLMDGREKLKDIASKAGFSSYNYFFKIFKEITGLTPQEYRNANNNSLKI